MPCGASCSLSVWQSARSAVLLAAYATPECGENRQAA